MISKRLRGLMYSSDFTTIKRISAQTISGGTVGAKGYTTTANTDYIKTTYPGGNTKGLTIIADVDVTFVNGRYQYIAITESVPNYYFDFIFEENVGTGADAGKKRLLFYTNPTGVLTTSSVYVSPGRHTVCVTVTTGKVLTFYVDGAILGTSFSGKGLGGTFISSLFIAGSPVGSYSLNGTIKRLEIYNYTYSATEIANDYSGKAFTYDNDWVVYHDFLADEYDLINKKIIDKSGKGFDSYLGEGSTASYFPTKLASKGISFDGSNDFTTSLGNISHNSTSWSVVLFFKDTSTTTAYRRWIMNNIGSIAVGFNGIREDSTSGIDVVLNGVSNVITGYNWKSRPSTIILTCDGTNSYLYLDGFLIGTISSKTGNFNGTKIYLGGYNSLGVSEHFKGDMYAVGINRRCLTPLEVGDLTYKLKKRLNEK